MKRRSIFILSLFHFYIAVILMAACTDQTVYYHYEHTPESGWEKNDTLTFLPPPIAVEGQYIEDVGLRISGDYPFMALNLIVEQTVLKPHPSSLTDTLTCSLIDEEGNASYAYSPQTVSRLWNDRQYLFPIPTSEILKNPSLQQNPGW